MTLVVKEDQAVVEQAVKQLQDLTPVWAVLDYSKTPLIERELCLVKVSLVGPDPNLAINDHLDHEKVR
jgi:acetolactate synthase-1/3 small subunit